VSTTNNAALSRAGDEIQRESRWDNSLSEDHIATEALLQKVENKQCNWART
jgi:hypothetical protein